jgi:hypothetical protein
LKEFEWASEPNPLDLVLGQPFLRSVIKFCRPGTLVRSHLLGVLERPAIREVRGDPGRSECMIANRRVDPRRGRAPADHAPGGGLIHGLIR